VDKALLTLILAAVAAFTGAAALAGTAIALFLGCHL
jgi:hypothetical protein